MARKRVFTTFNLSFLDIMSCGFGAVILVFLIIDHSIEQQSQQLNKDLLAEVNLLDEDIVNGEQNLVRLRNTISAVDLDIVEARGLANQIVEEIESYQSLLEALENEGLSSEPDIDKQQREIRQLEQQLEKLRATSNSEAGKSARSFLGDGNRQYLTGLNLGGRRVLILLDSSASMLAENIVNIIRLRNMDDEVKKQSEKWRRAINTVAWLGSNLDTSSQYQIVTFNTSAKPSLKQSGFQWLSVAERAQLDNSIKALDDLVPAGGTNLEKAFLAVLDMSPLPDNIFLITDGLPTQGAKKTRSNTINGKERQRLFQNALKLLPRNIPVNVILAPMEGDPMAASEFWKLAQLSKGSFLSPSKDWP